MGGNADGRLQCDQARDQLGAPGGAESFLRGAQIFELCPIVLDYGGENFSRVGFAPLVTGLSVIPKKTIVNSSKDASSAHCV